MQISFILTQSYLPEFHAYKEYCLRHGIKADLCLEGDMIDPSTDIIWKACGVDRVRSDRFLVHEYQSLSIPPFSDGKNYYKRILNVRPNYRVFLNQNVRDRFGFDDDVPFSFRDMGVKEDFFGMRSENKDFEFVYIGTLSKQRRSIEFLDVLRRSEKKTLIVGVPPTDIPRHEISSNIEFTGRLQYVDVPAAASRAEFGINYIPNLYPFNIQASTKLLEYCALGLKVLTTRYQWVNAFEAERNAKFFSFTDEINLEALSKFTFITPNVEDLEWNKLIKSSKLFEQILSIF